MGSMEIEAVQVYKELVDSLLDRAAQVKPDKQIEPPVTEALLDEPVWQVPEGKQEIVQPLYQQTRLAAVEIAFREKFYHILASTSIDEPGFTHVWNLLDIVSIFSDNEQCEPGLIFWLIEELLDSQTIDGCRKVFDYLESRRERNIKKHFKQKSLIILRSCNELLRRLSRAEDTVFCGRVFIFLFQSFPLGDKSSVNLRGEFHTENVTTYDETVKPATKDSGEDTHMTEGNDHASPTEGQTDEGSRPGSRGTGAERENAPAVPTVVASTDKEAEPQDGVDLDALYPVFWCLQSYFSAPSKMFDAERFASFKAGLEATLSAFKNINTELENQGAARSTEEVRKSNKRKRQADGGEVGDNFNPKYLTSRDLFDLEVSDTAFRRHVLVQALILLDFMLSLTPKAKARLADLTNKSVLYGFVLSDEDASWALNMRKRIEGYLRQGVGGNFYYRMVDTVLSRDKNWARWKAEGCPPIERPPVSVSDYLTARENATKTYASKRLHPSPMGALDLKFLSDSEALANVERLKEKDRFSVPAAQSFMMGIMDDEIDIDMAQTPDEKDAALRSKSSKTWRILRLSSKTKLSAFDKIDDGNNLKVLFENPGAPTESPQPAEGNEGVAQQSEEAVDGAKDTSADSAAENKVNANGTHQWVPSPSEEHASEPAPVGPSTAAVEDDHKEDPAT